MHSVGSLCVPAFGIPAPTPSKEDIATAQSTAQHKLALQPFHEKNISTPHRKRTLGINTEFCGNSNKRRRPRHPSPCSCLLFFRLDALFAIQPGPTLCVLWRSWINPHHFLAECQQTTTLHLPAFRLNALFVNQLVKQGSFYGSMCLVVLLYWVVPSCACFPQCLSMSHDVSQTTGCQKIATKMTDSIFGGA